MKGLLNPRRTEAMSKTKPTIGISFGEKLIGIALLIIGALLVYDTQTYSAAAGLVAPYSLAAGIIIAIAGVILLIVKTS
jgi:hypothetical protein